MQFLFPDGSVDELLHQGRNEHPLVQDRQENGDEAFLMELDVLPHIVHTLHIFLEKGFIFRVLFLGDQLLQVLQAG